MIQIIEEGHFAQLESIGHAFFTRHGGVSKGIYGALNCNEMSEDEADNIRENKARAIEFLGLPKDSMCTLRMVHGNEVVVVDKPWDRFNRPVGDAMVTRAKEVVLASDSADCPIVLLADEEAGVIGLAHAGWRGARSGIIENTVEKMRVLGADRGRIVAVIGPCITKDFYEVDSFFHGEFLEEEGGNEMYFGPSKNQGHFMFDLLAYVQDKLKRLAISSQASIGLDTYSNEDLFFSCRRAFHRKEGDFGGHLSCVYFKGLEVG